MSCNFRIQKRLSFMFDNDDNEPRPCWYNYKMVCLFIQSFYGIIRVVFVRMYSKHFIMILTCILSKYFSCHILSFVALCYQTYIFNAVTNFLMELFFDLHGQQTGHTLLFLAIAVYIDVAFHRIDCRHHHFQIRS